ncbi:hypothetical protein, partial [Acetomicrobium sp. S15 = DSM 107314]|uniref:hypothetical protein n=1 Tax=Acetomicrobium sp. S15 = DSM 107314 TaxID=2529858 RepID=UPI001E43C685
NNVETWANVPPIILNGSDWYAALGTAKSKGTKVFALTGKGRCAPCSSKWSYTILASPLG